MIRLFFTITLFLLLLGCSTNQISVTEEAPTQGLVEQNNVKTPELLEFTDPYGCYSLKLKADGVYFNSQKLEGADPKTFVATYSYNPKVHDLYTDKHAVYAVYRKQGCQAGLLVFPSADDSSLDILDYQTGLAKDNDFIYKGGNVVAPASVASTYLPQEKYTLTENRLSEDNKGRSEVLVEDISKLRGFPTLDEACGLNLFGYFGSKLLFVHGACGGGLFYYPVVSLDINNLGLGFVAVEDFFVDYFDIKFSKTKFLGIKKNDSREIYLLDITKDLLPRKLYEARPGERFFTPSFYGDDKINYVYLADDEIVLSIYPRETTENIPYSDDEEIPLRYETINLSLLP